MTAATAWLVAGAGMLLSSGIAAADEVVLPPLQDNTLYEDPAGALSNGSGEHLFAGRVGDKNDTLVRRALLAFGVTGAIPAGSTIQSAQLTLHVSRSRRAGAESFSLHRVLADWGEGVSAAAGEEGGGAGATANDATWIHTFYPGFFWASAGGDYQGSASATTLVDSTGFYTWSSAGMVADIQAWVDGTASDFGWMLRGNEGSEETAKRFDSRENGNPQLRPTLEIGFTPPAGSGACCAVDGTCSVVLAPGTACSGTYQGNDSTCDPNPCPEPLGACCLPNASASCVEQTETSCIGQGGSYRGALTSCSAVVCPVVLERFVDPLPLPAVAQPVSGAPGAEASYALSIREVQQQLHRDLPPTTVWGFGDGASGATYPGPTLEARTDEPVTVTWINDLRDTSQPGDPLRTEHYLPVDNCPHGADDDSPRTVIHLHGGHVAALSDGYPEATFLPGQQVVYEYPNWQPAATLWYHDHALGITRLNVYMGMAGFYLIRDDEEEALGLPSGEFEVPLAIQDRTFRPDGSLLYPEAWQDHFFGDTVLVNGKVWPFLDVKRGKYRLRIVSGSTSRTYTLSLSNGASFQQIGTDGGLLPAPVTVSEITLGPGERADVVVDFAPYSPGSEIVLQNSAPAPFPGDPGAGVIPDIVKFVVQGQTGHVAAVPAELRPIEALDELQASVTREFELLKGDDACTATAWLINGLRWGDITEFPNLGETEVWSFINRSGIMHPMHMHLVFFQVLDRQAFTVEAGQVVPSGPRVSPPPEEAGWKDTAKVGPGEIVRVIARFEDFTGRYAYHCHILEHEDHEMMRQFEAVTTCGDGAIGRPDEECEPPNTATCDASCQLVPEPGPMPCALAAMVVLLGLAFRSSRAV